MIGTVVDRYMWYICEECTLIVDTNLHVFLSNIELRQYEWRDRCWCWIDGHGGGTDEEREDKGNQERSSPVREQSTVIMTGKEFVDRSTSEKEGSGLSELGSSLLGSFQSLHSSQGRERDTMISHVPPSKEVKVLQFEDTLSEVDCRNFNLIYESLLLEGKAGNLTDLMLGMVLAENPLAWLQVMYGRLKHLIISSETFQKKKKAEYDAQAKTKQTSKGEGMVKHSKGIRYLGVSRKGKGKSLIEKVPRQR